MKVKGFVIGVFLSVFITLSASPIKAADEPFIWGDWITFYSLSIDHKAGSLKVAFGRRGKSATIYARILNDAALRVRGSVNFDLVDGDTGKVEVGKYAPFEAKPGNIDQSLGNWFMIPDRTLRANSFTVRNIRLKELWLPLPSDPDGPMYEYYPNNRVAAKQQEMQDAEKKKADTEQQRQATERNRQEEIAQRQRNEQQRQREAEAERIRRENQRIVDDANRQAQAHVDQYNRQTQGMQEAYQAGQDSKAEYERRKREIEERYADADDDVDYDEVERALKSAEFYADLKRKAEAEVRNYQNQAAYQTGAQKQVTMAAAAVTQIQVDKNARKEENYRAKARVEERKAKEEAKEQREEKKQEEFEQLRRQTESNNSQSKGISTAELEEFIEMFKNLPAQETPREYQPPTPEQMKANQKLLAAWMAMSGNEDIRKDAATWSAVSQAVLQGATDFNFKNGKIGATILHYAAGNNDVEAIKYLLNHGMAVDVVDKYERIPLDYAAGYDAVEAAIFLMKKGATRHQLSAALIEAAYGNSDRVASLLLAQDIDVNGSILRAGYPTSALIAAASRGADKIIPLLVARGADVNLGSPLAMASYSKQVKVVELLLAAGADANKPLGSTGVTPIFYAVDPYGSNSNFEMVEKLVAAGANVTSHDRFGKSLLHYVDDENADKIIPLLIAAGADVNARDKYKKTPLHQAIRPGSEKTLEQLLKTKGIDVNARDENGDTPLHYATGNTVHGLYNISQYRSPEAKISFDNIVRMLLAAGANPNLQNKSGETSLYQAADDGTDETIEMLLKAGAKRNIKDYRLGRTADYYLKQRKKNK